MVLLVACLTLSQPTPIAITHVNVVDVSHGRIEPNQTVVLEGDKIANIAQVAPPAGATLVDGKGKFLIPGLWDCHVHCWSDQIFFPLFLANGVTSVRDMFGPLDPIKKWRKDIESGKTLGPRIVAAGKIVDGPKPIWPGSLTAKDAAEGAKAVETLQKEGSDFVKVYSLLPRDAYFGIAAEAKKRKMVFAGHVPTAISASEASDAGQKSFEHLYSVLQGCSSKEADLLKSTTLSRMQRTKTMLDSFDALKARTLFAKFKKNGTWQCPTLVVLNSIAHLDDPKFRQDPRTAYLPAFVTATWDPTKDFRMKALTKEDFEAMRMRFDLECGLVDMMNKAGVQFLAGTDTPNPFCFPGFSLHDELALMVKCGFKPLQALQTATINPARYFGWEKTMGTAEKGKVADLVLLDANPLLDIHNTTKISAVFTKGRLIDKARIDQMLNKKTAQIPDPGIRTWGFDYDN